MNAIEERRAQFLLPKCLQSLCLISACNSYESAAQGRTRVGCRLLAAHTQLGSDNTQVSVRAATQVKTQLVRAAATRVVIDAIEGDNVSSRIQSLYV